MNEYLLEGLYGTTRKSYWVAEGDKGKARMIINHSRRLDLEKKNSRSRFIESILIENAEGERVRFPTNDLAPARAFTQHVSMGGTFADAVATQINSMAGAFRDLSTCATHVFNNNSILPEGAGAIRDVCRAKIAEMRKVFEKMSKPNGYKIEAAKIMEKAKTLNETGEEHKVSKEQMDEVRSLIKMEGIEFSDSLIESVCRAMMPEEAPLVEEKEKPTVGVLGQRVHTDAWAALAKNPPEIKLSHKIRYRSNIAEPHEREAASMGYTPDTVDFDRKKSSERLESDKHLDSLEQLIPAVEDDTLSNLLSQVSVILNEPTGFKPEEVRNARRIMMQALKAANALPNDGIASTPAIVEYVKWFSKLNSKALLEYGDYTGLPPRQHMGHNPYDDEEEYDQAVNDLVDNFDLDSFVDTYLKENGYDINELEPEERVIEESDILSSLNLALINRLEEESEGNHVPFDLMSEAKTFLPRLKEILTDKGFVINEITENEIDPFDEDDMADNPDFTQALHALRHQKSSDSLSDIHREVDEALDFDLELLPEGIMTQEEMDESLEHVVADMFGSVKKKSEIDEFYQQGSVKLSRSDILLPSENEQNSLAREVVKAKTKQPGTGKEVDPDENYVATLRTVAALRAPNPQTY